MRKITYSLCLLSVAIVFSSSHPNGLVLPVKMDYSDYRLNIIEANIPPLKDTVFGGNHCLITNCPLTLTNNTSDTLKYAGMSASWWDNYSIDNKSFSLAADYWNVFKNGQVVYVLPPHQSATKDIKIITGKDYKGYFPAQKLKIVMRLQKVAKLPIIGEAISINPDSNFLIWSNKVTIR
jgi:hypothetical protein